MTKRVAIILLIAVAALVDCRPSGPAGSTASSPGQFGVMQGSPTKCGDGYCDAGESLQVCPADCEPNTFSAVIQGTESSSISWTNSTADSTHIQCTLSNNSSLSVRAASDRSYRNEAVFINVPYSDNTEYTIRPFDSQAHFDYHRGFQSPIYAVGWEFQQSNGSCRISLAGTIRSDLQGRLLVNDSHAGKLSGTFSCPELHSLNGTRISVTNGRFRCNVIPLSDQAP